MIRVYNAELSGLDGFVRVRDRLFFHFSRYQWNLNDSSSNPGESEHRRRVVRRIDEYGIEFSDKESIKEECILAVSPFIGSYYHFMTDLVSFLLKRIEQLTKKRLLIPSTLPQFYKDYLIDLGFQIKEIKRNKNYFIEDLIIPDMTIEGQPEWTKEKLDIFRNYYFHYFSLPHDNLEKIYISRAKATKRHLKNEEQLLPCLKDCGFRVLHLEDMSINDQIQVFSQCDYLVAAHGAALTNVIFMAFDSKVLEIRPVLNSGQYCYEKLCSLAWKNYYFYVPRPKANFELDQDEFDELIRVLNQKK